MQVPFYIKLWFCKHQHYSTYSHKYSNRSNIVSEERPSTSTATNRHKTAKQPEVSFTAHHFDNGIAVNVEKEASETFDDKMEKQKHVVSAVHNSTFNKQRWFKKFLGWGFTFYRFVG